MKLKGANQGGFKMIELANAQHLAQLYRIEYDVTRNEIRGVIVDKRIRRRVMFRGPGGKNTLALKNAVGTEVARFVIVWKNWAEQNDFYITFRDNGKGVVTYTRKKFDDTVEMEPSEELKRRAHRTPVDPR